jgi:hypothetical protein
MSRNFIIASIFATLVLSAGCGNDHQKPGSLFKADVIIYGGTPAAITATIQVIKSVIGGLAREFYQRIYNYYQKPESWRWEKKEECSNLLVPVAVSSSHIVL